LRADLAQQTGATLVGADDAASGSLFTTVQGFITRAMSSAGAALFGFDWAALPAAINKIDWGIRTSQNGVSVLRYIPPSEWAAIANGTCTTNLSPYIQTAWNAHKHVYHPEGVYPLGEPILVPTQRKLTGSGTSTVFKALPALSGVSKPSITAGAYSPVFAKVQMF
jgi:hypothetical protein